MKIKILKDNNTAIDPRTVVSFVKDEVVDLNQELARDLIKYGLAVEVIEEKMLPKFENKAIFSATENKEEEVAPEIVEEVSENKEEIKINNKKKGKK